MLKTEHLGCLVAGTWSGQKRKIVVSFSLSAGTWTWCGRMTKTTPICCSLGNWSKRTTKTVRCYLSGINTWSFCRRAKEVCNWRLLIFVLPFPNTTLPSPPE